MSKRHRLLTARDFDLTPPQSLREVMEDELAGTGTPITDELIDKLMERVCKRVETEALQIYHSAEPWALKSWVYTKLLGDTVASEANDALAGDLISPVLQWQARQPFDPLAHFMERLRIERKTKGTIAAYRITAARFIGMVGRKRDYGDEDVLTYLNWATEHYTNENSYRQECTRVLQFLRRLPGGKNRDLPIPMPKPAVEFHQPTLTFEEVETLAWASVIDNLPPDTIVRLLVASVYGARRSELADLCSDDIHLGETESFVYIRTRKGGQRRRQPIPQSLVPLFAAPVQKRDGYTLQRRLRKLCKHCGVHLPRGGGFHSIRRFVVTEVSGVEPSDGNIERFMRWSPGRSMLARYRQTPYEQTDRTILEKHPMVQVWEELTPYVLKFNSWYGNL